MEAGYFVAPELAGLGFILFDGRNSGVKAFYRRDGLQNRWDWGDYSSLIKPDGTGLYYDFTNVPYGESTEASDVFKCTRR